MARTLEFWFEFASTYSYPAAMRIADAAGAAGVEVAWRPFLLGPIFAEQGWRDSPFNLYPARGRYMWRDLERICARDGLAFRRPSAFPRSGLLAARVARVGIGEGWGPDFVRSVYAANFAADRDISDPAEIDAILERLDVDAVATRNRALAPANKEALRAETERAASLGIFGAPSFIADGELYWGNDRLDEAVARARGRKG